MGAACKIGNHVREQARRGGDRRVGQAGGQDRRPHERLMGWVGKVCCAEGAGGGRAERGSRGKAAKQDLQGASWANSRLGLTGAGT